MQIVINPENWKWLYEKTEGDEELFWLFLTLMLEADETGKITPFNRKLFVALYHSSEVSYIEMMERFKFENTGNQLTIPAEVKNIFRSKDANETEIDIICQMIHAIPQFKNDKSELLTRTEKKVESWMENYPHVNLRHEFKEMQRWMDDNPKRIAAYKKWTQFVNNWLGKYGRKKAPYPQKEKKGVYSEGVNKLKGAKDV